jgi:hypothetical protein
MRWVRDQEDRLHIVDEDRALAVERAQVRQPDRDVARRRQLEEVGEQGLLIGDVQNGIAEHAGIVHAAPSARDGPMVPLRVVEVDDEADAAVDTHTPMPTRLYAAFIRFT